MDQEAEKIRPGRRFGSLTVVLRTKTASSGNARYRLRCDCGWGKVIARGSDLRSGKVSACVKCADQATR